LRWKEYKKGGEAETDEVGTKEVYRREKAQENSRRR
jgi:hypothetical protein